MLEMDVGCNRHRRTIWRQVDLPTSITRPGDDGLAGPASAIYDFGDDWVHTSRITDIRQGEPGIGYPRYVSGERSGRRRTAADRACGGAGAWLGRTR